MVGGWFGRVSPGGLLLAVVWESCSMNAGVTPSFYSFIFSSLFIMRMMKSMKYNVKCRNEKQIFIVS